MPAAIVTPEMAGQDLAEWAIALSEESYRLVVDDMTQGHRVVAPGALRRAIQTSSLSFVEILQGDDRPFSLTGDQVTIVRETARREFPLRDIVRGLRIVQRHWTEVLLDLAERGLPAAQRGARTRQLVAAITHFFDETVDAVMVEYLCERQLLLGRALGSRREVVQRLLAGELVEEAERVLGVDLAHHHLAVALAGYGHQPAGLERHPSSASALLDELSGCLHGASPLLVPGDEGEVWAWLSCERAVQAGEVSLVSGVVARDDRAVAGIGRPRAGRDGFCRSILDARDALRIARLRPTGQKVVAFDEVRLAALLSTDLERARSFVRDELGPLAADHPGTAELRATLRAYYGCEQSLVRTAGRLFLHRNTVVYRLRRIEQLLGRPVGEDALELHAALELEANLGPPPRC